jgi:DNA polymerase III subunit delta'
MAFLDIPGHVRNKNILKRALAKGRLPHALIFSGPEDLGKKDTALVLAQALNCLELSDDACGRCANCRAIKNGRFPDVLEIKPVTTSIPILAIRDMKQRAYLRPMSGRNKVFIIDDADKLGEAAAHSVLKVLEEPPVGTYLILVTPNPHLLLTTIVSRCQVLEFTGLAEEEIAGILIAEGHPEERARILALLAQGSLSRARDMDWEEIGEERRRIWELFSAVLLWDRPSRFLTVFSRTHAWRLEDLLRRTLGFFICFSRDCLLVVSQGNLRMLMNPDFEKPIVEVSTAAGRRRVLEVLDRVESLLQDLPKNLNRKLLVNSLFAGLEI